MPAPDIFLRTMHARRDFVLFAFLDSSILSLDSIIPFNQRLQNYFSKGKEKIGNGGGKDTALHQSLNNFFKRSRKMVFKKIVRSQ